MSDLLIAIHDILPAYPFEAPQGTPIPYGVWVRNEIPVRTKDGICGCEGTLTISVFAATLDAVTTLSNSIIDVVDNATFDGREYYYESTSSENYSDVGLVQKDVTFNFIE